MLRLGQSADWKKGGGAVNGTAVDETTNRVRACSPEVRENK